MRIETVTAANFEQLLPLIAAYQEFYRLKPDEGRNRAFFGRFLGGQSGGIQFIALDDRGSALGFATVYSRFSSARAQVDCLMNDLYVVPEARGQGVGRALIEHCRLHARDSGARELIWLTEQSNRTAQRLYDRCPATRTAWYQYRLSVGPG
jgi:GNAT superfamily N-acetyltransferase